MGRLYTRLERGVKHLLFQPVIWWRYGTLRPERVRPRGSKDWLYCDPSDPSVYKRLVLGPVRGKVSPNLVFWREVNAHLRPALAVDVGVNYGECLFGTRYAPSTRVFGFEANPCLLPFVERSRAGHPQREAMQIVHCIVSDQPAENVPFMANLEWSGGSSAVPGLNTGFACQEFKLPARTLDSQLPVELATGAELVFKMDIEGFESFALRGFTRTLDAVLRAVGCVEFNTQFIRAAGENPDTYFAWLAERFELYRFVSAKRRTLCRLARRGEIPARHDNPEAQCTDIIVVSRRAADGWLPPGWRVVTA